jgi:hypothetical protein
MIVIILNVIMLNVVMLNVIMLIAVAPLSGPEFGQQVRWSPGTTQISRLRGQRHDRQEPEAHGNPQKIDQVSML